MDGVLANVYAHFIAYEQKRSGNKIDILSAYGLKESEAFPGIHTDVNSKGFFRTVPLMPHSVKGLQYLHNKYNVLIVSSATEFPLSLTEKVEWLHEHFPFIGWQQIILCGRKDVIAGDIMIDDHPKNLNSFQGEKFIFTQPHNIYLELQNTHRVHSWEQIMEIL